MSAKILEIILKRQLATTIGRKFLIKSTLRILEIRESTLEFIARKIQLSEKLLDSIIKTNNIPRSREEATETVRPRGVVGIKTENSMLNFLIAMTFSQYKIFFIRDHFRDMLSHKTST